MLAHFVAWCAWEGAMLRACFFKSWLPMEERELVGVGVHDEMHAATTGTGAIG